MTIDAGMLDEVTSQFLSAFRQDALIVQHAANSLFYQLALIQLTLSTLWMVLSGESIRKLLSKLTAMMMTFGFFYEGVQHGGEWVPEILNGFVELGQQSGVNSIDPSSVVDQGVKISSAILHAFYGWGMLGHPFVSIIGGAVCLAIIIIYALIASELVIVIVKAYLLISLSSLFFAFGGSEFTRSMTYQYIKTIIGIGLQLMTLYFLIGVGQTLGAQWCKTVSMAASKHELMPMLVILAGVIVYFMIVKNIPSFIAGLSGVGGFRNEGDAAVTMAIQSGLSGAMQARQASQLGMRAAQSTGEMARGVSHLAQSAKQGAKSYSRGSGEPFHGAAMRGASSMLKSGMKATANTIKDSATRMNQNMTAGQKFNHHMREDLKSKSDKITNSE